MDNKKHKESEKYYQQIVNFANVSILRFDNESRLTDFTGNSTKIFGFSREEVIGKSLYETIVPQYETTGREITHLMDDIVKSTKTYEYNINQNITKSGRRLWMQWYNSEIKNESGESVGVLSIGIDITDKVNAEQALRESEERFRTLSNLTFEGIVIHDNGVILDCNLSFEKQIGYSREELLGMQIFGPIIPVKYLSIIEDVISLESGCYEAELIPRQGTAFPIYVESHTTIFKKKKVRVAALRNISEFQRTIQEPDNNNTSWKKE